MDNQEYRVKGKELIDFIGDYLRDIRKQRVFPNVTPGYMRKLLPDHAPNEPEPWDDIMQDVKTVIIPGVTHWQSPYMHAYFPALNSYPSLMGDMIADAINCLGFTWASSPACTELETIVMDWLGKMIGLPSDFLHSNTSTSGGGVIQTTASEATFISILAARTEAIRKVQDIYPEKDDSEINGRLIAYCSDQAHSSVEKAGLIGLVRMRYLASDDELSLRGGTLCKAIVEDREAGFIPFYLCASLGTTGACAFDNLAELGPICQEEEIYLHIDAAYSGSAFICPEYRFLMDGVEYAQSFAFNPSKWLMVHFDCTAMWIKDSRLLHRTFNVDPLYLKHENSGEAIDYMHWQIGLSKRFRSLKLWCVLRSFGVTGLQNHIRKGVELAKMMEKFVLSNPNFEIPAKRHLGMVVFRLKGENELTETLLKSLNSSGQLHMVPASLKGTYIIRFTVTSQYTTEDDIKRDWSLIVTAARDVVIKQGGLWVEEIEENVEIEVSEDESGLGDELQYTGSSDVVVPSEDRKAPSVTFKMADGAGTSTTGGVSGTGSIKVRRTKMVPRKQMSVVFDPRASARRRATAASAAQYIPENVNNMTGAEGGRISEATLGVKRGSNFGVSLLLSNTPHSPQFINGSYAAIFENPQVVDDIASHLRRLQTEYSPWRQGPPPTKTIDSPNYVERSSTNEFQDEKNNCDDTTEDGEEDEMGNQMDKSHRNSKSSAVFKKAIENLFETYDSTNKISDSGRPSCNSATLNQTEGRRAAFKHLAPGRQYSLDSRLNFYSRAINDISAAAKAAVQGEAGSLKPQRRELGTRVPQTGPPYPFDKTSEAEDEDEQDMEENFNVASPPDHSGGTVCTEDCYPAVRVKEDSLYKMAQSSKEEEIDNAGQGLSKLMPGTSLRRRRRIIDPPTHVPALPRGGVSSGTNDALAKVIAENVITNDSVGVQVEENMLPFEDQPFSSPYITAPTYVGQTFQPGGESCENVFSLNANDKMVEVNVNNNLGWAKVKRKLVNTASKNEFGTSKELEWESTIPQSNRAKLNDVHKPVNRTGAFESDKDFNIKIIRKASSNNNLPGTFCETPKTQVSYLQYNTNNNNTNDLNALERELYLMLNINQDSTGKINFIESKLDGNVVKDKDELDVHEPRKKPGARVKKDSLITKLGRIFGSESITWIKNSKEKDQIKVEPKACPDNFPNNSITATPIKDFDKFKNLIMKNTLDNPTTELTSQTPFKFLYDRNRLQLGHPLILDYNNNLYIQCDNCGHKMVPDSMNFMEHKVTKAREKRSSSLPSA